MNTIATLTQLQRRLELDAGVDDERLLWALRTASAEIERHCARRFTPHSTPITHDIDTANATELLLDDDLLSLVSIATNDEKTISVDGVVLNPDEHGPASVLLLTKGQSFTWKDTPINAATITGVWGWHDDYANAWRDTNDNVEDNPLSASATSITVSNADGVDAALETPRFQVGQLLRIGTEFVRVLAVDTVTDTLTVERGANGTEATSHTQGEDIYSYQAPVDVVNLVLRWASWIYREPDLHTAGDIPADLLRSLELLRRVRVRG